MGTKQSPGAFDCYANAEADEPMFVLLARDRHAPTLVWLWAALREIDREDPAKVAEARACVAAMIEWAHEHGRQSVGLGASALAAVLELIRASNHAAEGKNRATDIEVVRLFLAATKFEHDELERGA